MKCLWGRYSPYLPMFLPSRLEQHNFTLIADQSSNSLFRNPSPALFILIFASLAMVAVQSSSALPELPTPVTEKKSFRSLGLNLTILVPGISLSDDKLFPPLELLCGTRQVMAIKYLSQKCCHLTACFRIDGIFKGR